MNDLPDALVDALADRYRLERTLGEGGMATVYLAQDLRHNRRVAVKVMRPVVAEAMGADRFLKEIEVTAGLQHPNIVPLFDSGRVGDLLWFAMPYLEGESLRARIDRDGLCSQRFECGCSGNGQPATDSVGWNDAADHRQPGDDAGSRAVRYFQRGNTDQLLHR